MPLFVYVFIGGGLGSLLRYAISKAFASSIYAFPFGTMIANVIACILLGYFSGLGDRVLWGESGKALFMTGLCGGFSTFSTFSGESLKLLQEGQIGLAFINIAASILLCLAAVYIGINLK